MSIKVTIKNGQLLRKPLKLTDLTMGKYAYGSLDGNWRNTGELVEGYNVLYDPNRIGRGIEFSWSKNVKDKIELHVNFISTKYDMEMFYQVIRNILHVWKAKSFEHDGETYHEEDLNELCQLQKELNLRYMSELKQDGVMIVFGAMFPISVKYEKLANYGMSHDEEGYADYLHELQSQDAYYAVPIIYQLNEEEFFGSYSVTATTDIIFPKQAMNPVMTTNLKTGEPLECSFFVVTLVSLEQGQTVGTMSFDEFIAKAKIMECPEFDETHVLLKGLSEEELQALAESEHSDPFGKICQGDKQNF